MFKFPKPSSPPLRVVVAIQGIFKMKMSYAASIDVTPQASTSTAAAVSQMRAVAPAGVGPPGTVSLGR